MVNGTQSLEGEVIYPLKVSKVFVCVDCLQKAPGFLGPIEMTQTVMKRSLLVSVPGFAYFRSLS